MAKPKEIKGKEIADQQLEIRKAADEISTAKEHLSDAIDAYAEKATQANANKVTSCMAEHELAKAGKATLTKELKEMYGDWLAIDDNQTTITKDADK